MTWDSMRFRNFKENEWHTFWGMISAAVADIPDVITGITDIGSKCSAVIGTVDAGIEIWKIVNQHKIFHDAVKRKIFQHVPEALGDNVPVISKAIFEYLNSLKKQDRNISYFYVNKKDEEFVNELYSVCVHAIPVDNISEPELRFFLGEVAKLILDPDNAVLLTEDEDILKELLTSVRNLNNSFGIVQDAQHELKGELRRFLQDYRDLAAEVYELTDEVSQIRDDVEVLKNDVSVIKDLSPAQYKRMSDNQEYLDRFDEPLFLEEDDDSKVTLASMYVSPHVSGTSDMAADRIMAWFSQKSRKTCMLLYGSAGIGKSTLVSKIIADANKKSTDIEFDLQADQVLAVALRNHCGDIDIEKSSSDILVDLFGGYTKEELKDKLLILDGLDEICVLKREFDGHTFLKKMAQINTGFHILVTSREAKDYFNEPTDIPGIQIEHLNWERDELIVWCSKYAVANEEKGAWCKQFVAEYIEILEKDVVDGRKEIFCVPIILYICGNRGISLSDHKSVGSIYDDAFRSILLRNHIQYQEGQVDLAAADAKTNANLIAWQYTKELAYQMFLLNTLDLAESSDPYHPSSMGLNNARSRTKAFLKEKYDLDVNNDSLELKKELALCPFTKSNSSGGITFAHKSVYEYFTAVKLYEDYFAQFSTKYFQKTKPETEEAAKAVLESYIDAFRYRWIPKEIFAYLNSMKEPPFSGSVKVSAGCFDAEHFLQAYVYGMEKNILSRNGVKAPVSEYNYWTDPVSVQFNRAYQNFTWFLSGHGFKNADNNDACKRIRDLLTSSDTGVCLTKWGLSGSYLSGSDLSKADLSNADLSSADLSSADLSSADLSDADLRGAYLSDASLSSAVLCRTNLSGANLCGADLRDADLRNANLSGAYLDGVDLRGADLRGADLRRANVSRADLSNANLSGTNLSNAELIGSDLTGAIMTDSSLTEINFSRSDLSGAHLNNADLRNASMNFTNLKLVDLSGADLSGAELNFVYMRFAHLESTNMKQAHLKSSDLSGTIYCRASDCFTQFPSGFDPDAHGMIEVDKNGDPIKQ